MKKDLVGEEKERRDLVGDNFGGMEVACIETNHNVGILHTVAHIELVRTNGECFDTNCEYLGFYSVLGVLGIELLSFDLVERIEEARTGCNLIVAVILVSVGNPDVVYGTDTCALTEELGDLSGLDAVVDPELTDTFVGMRKCKTVGALGMREASGGEVETDLLLTSSVCPLCEAICVDGISVYLNRLGLGIESVDVCLLGTGDERESKVHICS